MSADQPSRLEHGTHDCFGYGLSSCPRNRQHIEGRSKLAYPNVIYGLVVMELEGYTRQPHQVAVDERFCLLLAHTTGCSRAELVQAPAEITLKSPELVLQIRVDRNTFPDRSRHIHQRPRYDLRQVGACLP